MTMIDFPTERGEARGYLAIPKSEEGFGVIVLHAWWGLNEFFQSFCERLSGKGFVVLAPDFYHGATTETVDEAKRLRSKVNRTALTTELAGAAAHVRSLSAIAGAKIGVIGFSLGAYWASWLADSRPDDVCALVLFYGMRTLGKSRVAVMGHFAEDDNYTPVTRVRKLEKQLKSAGREASIFIYPGTRHWFFEKNRLDAYDAEAARLAWDRTLKFLEAHSKLA